jgi:serine/threonine-protein kinase HipA
MSPATGLSIGVRITIRAFANERANWAAVDLAIELPGANTLGAVTRDSIFRPGEIVGVPRRIGERELDRLMRLLPPTIDRLKQQIERENVDLVGPARVFLAGESRLVATIKHVVVRDMLQRLGAAR